MNIEIISGLKMYLPVYLLLYLGIAFILPSYRTYKKTGINPVTFGKADTAHDYIGFVMKLLVALLFVTVLMFSFGEKWYTLLVPIPYLQKEILHYAGLIIIHLSLFWIAVAQFQMGNSWRIGIDPENETILVTQGIFSVSRNPIFLGMIASMAGLFLILPNMLTFFITLAGYFIIQIQIRLEEEFLSGKFGKQYELYQLKTRRLL
jgi:protein-S-isoprenylcysteine O-methyltransferase Ste14